MKNNVMRTEAIKPIRGRININNSTNGKVFKQITRSSSLNKDVYSYNEKNIKNIVESTPIKTVERLSSKPKTTAKKALVPLDPKMYRITFEEFKQGQFKGNLLQNIRGGSAHKSYLQSNKLYLDNKCKSNTIKESIKITAKDSKIREDSVLTENDDLSNHSSDQNKKQLIDNEDMSPSLQRELETKKNIEMNTALIAKALEAPKDQCYYCLRKCLKPVILPCSHIICSSCIEENVKIEELLNPLFLNNKSSNTFKCPKCSDQSSVVFPSLSLPLIPPLSGKRSAQNIKCEICQIPPVEFDCLNCDLSICSQCKISHLSNPNTQKHKIIPYEEENKISQDITKCPIHQITFEYFCLNENTLICPKCAELLHKDHYYKKLAEVDAYFYNELKEEITQSNKVVERIIIELLSLNNISKTLTKECTYFMSEANKYFEDIVKIIYSRKAVMQNRIKEWFNLKSVEISKVIEQLSLVKERYYSFFNHQPYCNLEKMQQIRNMRTLNEQIGKFDFNTLKKYSNYSYKKYSMFAKIPIKAITKLMNKFAFLPLDLVALEELKECFKESNIIKKNLITPDLLLTLPKITEGKLLYSISEVGPSPEEFHSRCDMKGATIIIIETDTGHIFGGFNPFDWKSEFIYEETTSSFLFSISDGKIRKPMKCKIRKMMKEFAIKQNEKEYSPAFGIADRSDLLIAFKKLQNSYSKLGYIYKCPKGYNGDTFLAGKTSNWNIVDIEVYGIKYLNENDFYLFH